MARPRKEPGALRVGEPAHGLWPVDSGVGEAQKRYWVDPNAGACDCPAGLRRTRCKHLAAVRDELEAGARTPPRP